MHQESLKIQLSLKTTPIKKADISSVITRRQDLF